MANAFNSNEEGSLNRAQEASTVGDLQRAALSDVRHAFSQKLKLIRVRGIVAVLAIWLLDWQWSIAVALLLYIFFGHRFLWVLGEEIMYSGALLLMLKLAWQWLTEIAIALLVIVIVLSVTLVVIYNGEQFLWTQRKYILGIATALICTFDWKYPIAIAIVIIAAVVFKKVLFRVFITGELVAVLKGNKVLDGIEYGRVAAIYFVRGDYKNAIEYHSRRLALVKETGDRATEGRVYGEIGEDFYRLGDIKAAIDYFKQELRIVKELRNMMYVGLVSSKLHTLLDSLGIAYLISGESKKAVECFKQQLSIAEGRQFKDKAEEGRAYRNIGLGYYHLYDFSAAIYYYALHPLVAIEVGDHNEQGGVYENLGKAHYHMSDFRPAIEYHNLHLAYAKKTGDKAGEGRAYGNLGCVYASLGDSKRAIDYQNLHLRIAKEVGDKVAEAQACRGLGISFELQEHLPKALEYYRSSVAMFDSARDCLKSEDEWKISLRNEYKVSCNGLWRVLLKQDKIFEALVAAEKGRSQVITDLVECRYGTTSQPEAPYRHEYGSLDRFHELISSSTAFQAVDRSTVYVWVLSEARQGFRKHKLDNSFSFDWEAQAFYRSLIEAAYKEIGVRDDVRCENRSLDTAREYCIDEMSRKESSHHSLQQVSSMSTLSNIAIEPFADLVQGEELIIVPDGPLWLVPYAAFVGSGSKYLCESFRIRLIPSLTSLTMMADLPEGYHCKSGALLVGDPCVEEVTDSRGEKLLEQLQFAKQEVEMIGEILEVTPLTGKEATKSEVLKRLSSVGLVHIAAHGRMETGEIAVSPNPERTSSLPTKDDYVLTMTDIASAQPRASLVVLSCFHSAQEEPQAEGVMGIARAFMGAGARSVLVSLWAIDDEATLEFMRSFYHHLVQGKSASESLNLAMKDLRESDKYSDVKYWAPFVLIGDDVTLEFDEESSDPHCKEAV